VNVIKNLFESNRSAQQQQHQGHGLVKINTNARPEYVYWDDLNELDERLQLLHASQLAGHTSIPMKLHPSLKSCVKLM
jgi:hypothetical protein